MSYACRILPLQKKQMKSQKWVSCYRKAREKLISVTTPSDFIKEIFRKKSQSVCISILGKKQSGKTDFMLRIMETLYKLDLMEGFGSNMPMEAPFEVDFIEDFQTLKRRCQMMNPKPTPRTLKRYFYFGSEMGKWLPKDQAWKNTKFIEELQTIRKYGLCFAGDAIDRVEGRVLNETHFDGQFTKYNPKNPTVAYYDDWITNERTHLKKIPRTTIKFDTFYSANFYMEPQTPETLKIPLSPEHEIVKKYLEHGSWKKADIETKKGKRAVQAVLRFHLSTCLHDLSEEKDVSTPANVEIA